MNEEEKETNVEMGFAKKPFLKKKLISTRVLIILLVIAWASGFIWRGIYT